jgi:hypothetical protein
MKAFRAYGDRTEPPVLINVPFGEMDFKHFGMQGVHILPKENFL